MAASKKLRNRITSAAIRVGIAALLAASVLAVWRAL